MMQRAVSAVLGTAARGVDILRGFLAQWVGDSPSRRIAQRTWPNRLREVSLGGRGRGQPRLNVTGVSYCAGMSPRQPQAATPTSQDWSVLGHLESSRWRPKVAIRCERCVRESPGARPPMLGVLARFCGVPPGDPVQPDVLDIPQGTLLPGLGEMAIPGRWYAFELRRTGHAVKRHGVVTSRNGVRSKHLLATSGVKPTRCRKCRADVNLDPDRLTTVIAAARRRGYLLAG